MKLSDGQAIFVGFKLEGSLKHQLGSLSGPDAQYVSRDESTFLRICTKDDHPYVGKVIREPLATDRVEDVRRNVISIVGRLCPDVRLPTVLQIWVCEKDTENEDTAAMDKVGD